MDRLVSSVLSGSWRSTRSERRQCQRTIIMSLDISLNYNAQVSGAVRLCNKTFKSMVASPMPSEVKRIHFHFSVLQYKSGQSPRSNGTVVERKRVKALTQRSNVTLEEIFDFFFFNPVRSKQ